MSFIDNFKKEIKNINDIKYDIPVIQRQVEPTNITKIYEFQKDYYDKKGSYCLNNSISIGRDLSTGIEYLLDGQHRMAAYIKLKDAFPDREMFISIDLFDCIGMQNIELAYEYINTHNPNPITKLGLDDYKILQSFGELMNKKFKIYLKDTKKPQRPNINLNIVKDVIKDKELIQKCNIKTGEQLFEYVLSINTYYCNLDQNQFSKWGISDYSKILEKIRKNENKLYLSLYSNFEWIDRLIEHITLKKSFNELNHLSNCYRPKIKKALKTAVWTNTNGNSLNGTCYCCEKSIEFTNFICGHVIPVSIGGETNIKNIKAICYDCNSDMGTMNLEEYKKQLSEQMN